MFEKMIESARTKGKPEWREMLVYNAMLHERDLRPAEEGFPYPWEEIGVGYCYGPAFGHWDIAHIIMDEALYAPENAAHQIENDLFHQREDGFLPGSIYLRGGKLTWGEEDGHAPMWIYAADTVYSLRKDEAFLRKCLCALKKQIGWFEHDRRAENGGYYYLDILGTRKWESGIDEGIRFLHCGDSLGKKHACVDATAHVFGMTDIAVKWSGILGEDAAELKEKRERIRRELDAMYDPDLGWYFDSWDRNREGRSVESFEGMFPLTCGACSKEQAEGVRRNLMDESKFFTAHPIATVAADNPRFEKRMWRGPAWNSMTMWAVFGLMRAGFYADAARMCERTLDDSAKVFAQTGKVWEFYDSLGGDPRAVKRKPDTPQNMPCADYAGHAVLMWLADAYETCRNREG